MPRTIIYNGHKYAASPPNTSPEFKGRLWNELFNLFKEAAVDWEMGEGEHGFYNTESGHQIPFRCYVYRFSIQIRSKHWYVNVSWRNQGFLYHVGAPGSFLDIAVQDRDEAVEGLRQMMQDMSASPYEHGATIPDSITQ